MKHHILFQHNSKDGKVRRWECWARGDTVITRYGIDGGKMQETCDVPGSKGKKGTKAYVDPVEQAGLVVERMVKKKTEEGYRPEGMSASNLLDLRTAYLPKNLVLPKPVKEMPEKKLEKSLGGITDFDFVFTRKRDGMMAILVAGLDGEVKLYSRRMDDLSFHFPHIVAEAEEWLPPGSMVAGELLCRFPEDTPRTFKWVSKVVRSKARRARGMQEEEGWEEPGFGTGLGRLHLYVFSIIAWGGEELYCQETQEQLLTRVGCIHEGRYIQQVEIVGCDTLEELKEIILEEEWEGAVAYLRYGKMEPIDLSFGGKERRPKVYWKVKVFREDDFIITDWALGSGKNMNRLGRVWLGKLKADGSGYVSYGKCGTGFSDEEREEWATDDIVGKVVTVEFDRFTEDGKLRFARFIRMHLDKTEEEVVEDEG